ncbi:MAG: carboxymuconolactone decarboxylase family protein [Ramlibacter sp.]|nr:carboxymuconolactone decarboxylase family protein [Ramlibacter sp.]
MPRISPVTPDNTPAASAPLLAAVKAKLGVVPGMMATWAHAPAALKAYLAMAEALGSGTLSAGERELVALAAAEANQCEYCLAAHHVLGKGAGLSDASVAAAREGHGTTPREQAIAMLTRQIVLQRGLVSDAEFAAARSALGEAGVLEVIGAVALNLYTNYTNHIAQTEVDFPRVALREPLKLAA